MSGDAVFNEESMQQLLADRATEGLDDGSSARLEALLVSNPSVDADAFDRTAAAISLAQMPGCHDPLSALLRERILEDARAFFDSSKENQPNRRRAARRAFGPDDIG